MTADPRRFLMEFRRREYGVDENNHLAPQFAGLARNLRNAIEQLSEGLYASDVHFLLELIQNAEDNTYPSGVIPQLRLVLLAEDPTGTPGAQGCLCVFNNERGFQAENVESLCRIGASTKKNRAGYIGEKGIGFKSVFVASHAPHVFSNGFRFMFREEDRDLGLSYVIPYWVEHLPEVVRASGETTAILLPLKPGRYAQLESELTHIPPETLLFLNKLEQLEIHIPAAGVHRTLARRRTEDGTLHLRVADHGEWRLAARYWVEKRAIPVPEELDEPKREGITHSEVSIALPLDGQPIRGTIYAFLPTGVESGLPFLVNADFLLPANRETLHLDRPWNHWLRDAAALLAADAIENLVRDARFRPLAYGFIPLADTLRDLRGFFEPLVREVQRLLAPRPIVWDDRERLIPPSQAWLADAALRAITCKPPRPAWFQEHALVHEALQNHERRLRAIGVRDLRRNAAQLLTCINDPEWLTKLDIERLAALIAYLRERHFVRAELAALPLLPLDDGRRVALDEAGAIYLASGSDTRHQLTRLQDHGLPAVQALDEALADRLRERNELWAWFRETFTIRPFSLADHLNRVIIPWLKGNRETLQPDAALALLQLVGELWDDLDTERRKSLAALPLPTADGRLIAPAECPSGQMATPPALDPEDGWQHVFSAPGDADHLIPLSDRCLEAIPDRERLRTILTGLGATPAPAPRQVRLGSEDLDDPRLAGYLHHIIQGRPHGRALTVETPFPPRALFEDQEQPQRRARALQRWLEKRLSEAPLHSQDHAQLRLGHPNERPQRVESALQWFLRRTPWIPLNGRLHPPVACFQEAGNAHELLGQAVPVIEPPLAEPVARYLGIKTRLDSHDLIAYLREMAEQEARPDPELVARIYQYLQQHADQPASLRDLPLIHLPDEGRWIRADQAVWEDTSELLGPGPWLAPHYARYGLRDWFLALGAAERPDLATHIRAWLALPQRQMERPALEKALCRIYARIGQALRREELTLEERDHIREQARLADRLGRLRRPQELLLDDDPELAALYPEAGDDFVWCPDGLSPAALAPLFDLFPISRLSAVVEVRLATPIDPTELRSEDRLFPHPARRLLAHFLFSEHPEAYQMACEDQRLPRLLAARVESLPSLPLEAHWPAHGRHPLPRRGIHWDDSNGRLLVDRSLSLDVARDELAERLAQLLLPSGEADRLVDTIHRILECDHPHRAERLAGKRGWRTNDTEAARIEEWIGQSDLPTPETEEHTAAEKATPLPHPAPGPAAERSSPPPRQRHEHFRLLPLESEEDRPNEPRRETPEIFVLDFPDRPLKRRPPNRTAASGPRRASGYATIPTLLHPVGNGADTPRCHISPAPSDEGPASAFEDKAALTFAAAWFEVRGYQVELAGRDSLRVTKGARVQHILVKGVREKWPEEGLPLERDQHDRLRDEETWLLVVEHLARPSHTRAHLIARPAAQLRRYHLDPAWRRLSEEPADH